MIPEHGCCPICSSTRVHFVPFQYLHNERRLAGKKCMRCGIIFISPQPTAEELRDLYSREYFEGGDFRCGHEGEYCNPETLEHLASPELLQRILSRVRGKRFLEVGCAGGALLNAARDLGFQVQGVELSEVASAMAREKFGVPVFTGTIESAEFPDASFDVAYLGDVIEHLPDPVESMKELHRILDVGGLLVLALPTQTNTLFSRIGFGAYTLAGRTATVALPPYHLFEYRPGSLKFLLLHSGFQIETVRQGIIPPQRINLRGPWSQRAGKQIFHYPNWVLTTVCGICGDRLEVFARKVEGN
jgi:SAM-dependent methyltransferase